MEEAAIEKTVISILKASDFETATELSIRTITAQRLGLHRFSLDQKRFIRSLIESFLLGTVSRTPVEAEEAAREGINGVHCSELAARGGSNGGQKSEVAARGGNNGGQQSEVAARGGNNGGQQSELAARGGNNGGQQLEVAARGENYGGQQSEVAARGGNNGGQQLEVAACGENYGGQQLGVAARGENYGGQQLEMAVGGGINGVQQSEVVAGGTSNGGQQLGVAARVTNDGVQSLEVAARGRSNGGQQLGMVARGGNDGGHQLEVAARGTSNGWQQLGVEARGANYGGQSLEVAARGTNNGVQPLEVAARGTNNLVQPLEVAVHGANDGGQSLEVAACGTNDGGQLLEVAVCGTNKDGGDGVHTETRIRKMGSVTNNGTGLQELEMAAGGTNKNDGNGVQELEMAARGMSKDGGSGVQEQKMEAHAMNNDGCNDVQRLEAAENRDIVLGLEVQREHHQEGGCGGNGGGGDYVEDDNSRIICELSQSRDVTVDDFRGQSFVTIRDRYQKDGMPHPKFRRMSLSAEQWSSIKNNIPAVEDAITRMQTRLRLPAAGKPSDQYVSRPVVDSAQANVTEYSKHMDSFYSAQEPFLEGSKQMEVESIRYPSGFVHMPIRFDGKNYYLWKHQMEFLLSELKIAYVLTEACPSISTTISGTRMEMDQARACTQKWAEDDFICRQKILTSLCDKLYNDYSRKACNAKELWEELKSVYDEDIGTRRSQINKYVQFQIVDSVSILEQVHELHSIAHSISASGTWIDDYFHVSLVISKLPPSWKEFRLRMMRKEVLPLDMLMHCLKVEEDARNAKQLGKHSKPNAGSKSGLGSKCESRVGSQGKEKKRICYNCKKAGHISNNCPDRKTEVSDNGNTKEKGGRSYKWVRDLHHV